MKYGPYSKFAQHRFVLAVLLIVFIAGTVIISNTSPTGFQTAVQQLPEAAALSKTSFVSQKQWFTNYPTERTIDFGRAYEVFSVFLSEKVGGQECTAKTVTDFKNSAGKDVATVTSGNLAGQDRFEGDVRIGSGGSPEYLSDDYIAFNGLRKIVAHTTEAEESFEEATAHAGQGKILKFIPKVGKALGEVGFILEHIKISCPFIDDLKATIVFKPTPQTVSFDKNPPVFDKITIKPTQKYRIPATNENVLVIRASRTAVGKKTILNDYSVEIRAHDDQSGIADFIVTATPQEILTPIRCAASMACQFHIRELESEAGKVKTIQFQIVNGAGLKTGESRTNYIVATPEGVVPPVVSNSEPTETNNEQQPTISKGRSGPSDQEVPSNSRPVILDFRADPSSVTGSRSVNFHITASDPDSDKLTYTLYFDISQEADVEEKISGVIDKGLFGHDFIIAGVPHYYPVPDSSSETYTAQLVVKDSDGNSASKRTNIIVFAPQQVQQQSSINQNPVITSFRAAPSSGAGDTAVTFYGAATDPNNDQLTYTLDYGVSGKTETGKITSKESTLGSAFKYSAPLAMPTYSYTATLQASDGKGGLSKPKSAKITLEKVPEVPVDTILPTVSVSYTPQKPKFGDNIQLTAIATDNVGVKSIAIYVVGADNAKNANGLIDTCTFSTPQKTATCTKEAYKKTGYNQLLYTATATDTSENTFSPNAATIVLQALPDKTPPIITLSHSPLNPTISDKVTITASATDETNLQSLDLYVDGQKVSAKCTASGSSSGGPRGSTIGGRRNSFTSGYQTFFSAFWSITGAQILRAVKSTGSQSTGGNQSTTGGTPFPSKSVSCTYTSTYNAGSHVYYAVATDTSTNSVLAPAQGSKSFQIV